MIKKDKIKFNKWIFSSLLFFCFLFFLSSFDFAEAGISSKAELTQACRAIGQSNCNSSRNIKCESCSQELGFDCCTSNTCGQTGGAGSYCSDSGSCKNGFGAFPSGKLANLECLAKGTDNSKCCYEKTCSNNDGMCTSGNNQFCSSLKNEYTERLEGGDIECGKSKTSYSSRLNVCCVKSEPDTRCSDEGGGCRKVGTCPFGTAEYDDGNEECFEMNNDLDDICCAPREVSCEWLENNQPCTNATGDVGSCEDGKCIISSDPPDPVDCSEEKDGTSCKTDAGDVGTCKEKKCVKNSDPDPVEFCSDKEDGSSCTTEGGKEGVCGGGECGIVTYGKNYCDQKKGMVCTANPCEKPYAKTVSDSKAQEECQEYNGEDGIPVYACCMEESASDDDECKSAQEGIEGGFLFFKGSIVPCGRSCDVESTDVDETKTCTLCHFIIMFFNIFELLISLLVVVALLFITISGVAFLISAGNPNLRTTAKNILTKTLTGFGIALLSWLIIFTLLKFISANNDMLGSGGKWNEFKCETESVFDKSGINPDPDPDTNKNLVVEPNNLTFMRTNDAQDKEREVKVYYNKEDKKVSILDGMRIAGAEGENVTMEAEYTSTDENIVAINKDKIEKKVIIYSIAHPEDNEKEVAPQKATITIKYKEYTTTIDVTLFNSTCDKEIKK